MMAFVGTLSNGLPGSLPAMVAPPPTVMSHAALPAHDSHIASSTSVVGSHLSNIGSATIACSNGGGGPSVTNLQSSHDRTRRYLAREAPLEYLTQLEDRVDIGACVRIGAGSLGDVLLAQDKVSMQRLAVKVISLSRSLDAHAGGEDRFRREVQIMQDLKHPNIVQLVDVFVCSSKIQQVAGGPPYLCIAMDYVCDSEPLSRAIMSTCGSPTLALQVLSQLASALALMHQRGLVHRDVWSENVLVDKIGHVVLIDLGCAEYYRSGPAVSNKLNIPYISPQAARGLPQQPGDDCWAVGLLISEMVTGRFVSDRLGRTDVPLHCDFPELNRARGETLLQGGQLLGQLCTRLLEFEPSRRLTMAEVVMECSTSQPKGRAYTLQSQQSGGSAPSRDSSPTRGRQTSQPTFAMDGSVNIATATSFDRSQTPPAPPAAEQPLLPQPDGQLMSPRPGGTRASLASTVAQSWTTPQLSHTPSTSSAAVAGEPMRIPSCSTLPRPPSCDPRQPCLQAQQGSDTATPDAATGNPRWVSADRTKAHPCDPGQLNVHARPPIAPPLSRSPSDVSLAHGNVDETLISNAKPSGIAVGQQVTYQSRTHDAHYSAVVLGRSVSHPPGWIVRLNRGGALKKVEDHEIWRLSFADRPLSSTAPSSRAATPVNARHPTPQRVSLSGGAPAPSAVLPVHSRPSGAGGAGMVAWPPVAPPGPPPREGPGRFSRRPTPTMPDAGRGPERSAAQGPMRHPGPPRQNGTATPTRSQPPRPVTQAPHPPAAMGVGRVAPSHHVGLGCGSSGGAAAAAQRASVAPHSTEPGGGSHTAALPARRARFPSRLSR